MNNLSITKGNEESYNLTFTAGEAAQDITGVTVVMTVKRSLSDTTATITKTVTEHTDATGGKTTITLDTTDTDIPLGVYFYEMHISGGSLPTKTFLSGVLNVTWQATDDSEAANISVTIEDAQPINISLGKTVSIVQGGGGGSGTSLTGTGGTIDVQPNVDNFGPDTIVLQAATSPETKLWIEPTGELVLGSNANADASGNWTPEIHWMNTGLLFSLGGVSGTSFAFMDGNNKSIQFTSVVSGIGAMTVIVEAPATATSTGQPGQIAYDSSYLYICTAVNTWKRTTLSSW